MPFWKKSKKEKKEKKEKKDKSYPSTIPAQYTTEPILRVYNGYEFKLIYGSQFYRPLRNNLNHNGFQWKIGLNIDTQPFDPTGTCKSGGLFFQNFQHLPKYLMAGRYTYKPCEFVGSISVPDNARVCVIEDVVSGGSKFKADQLYLNSYVKIEEFHLWYDAQFCNNAMAINPQLAKYFKYIEIRSDFPVKYGSSQNYVTNVPLDSPTSF